MSFFSSFWQSFRIEYIDSSNQYVFRLSPGKVFAPRQSEAVGRFYGERNYLDWLFTSIYEQSTAFSHTYAVYSQ